MVRLILTGGLGNQMFEYAAAKSLALRLNKELTIDLYAINKRTQGTKRKLALDVFDLDLNISSSWQSKFLVKLFPIAEKNRLFFNRYLNYFRDQSAIVYLPEFETQEGNVILHGHFQNEKYFAPYKDIIQKEFAFKKTLDTKNQTLDSKIKNTESVSIHIRRGDYLSDGNFAICDAAYYQKAIRKIRESINSPFFFVFSEDMEWAKKNINFGSDSVDFIGWNKGNDSYKDMQLMSMCKHNIIANSSFSWWAAWLNNNRNKIVLANNQWFVEKKRNKDLSDFYPKDWIIID